MGAIWTSGARTETELLALRRTYQETVSNRLLGERETIGLWRVLGADPRIGRVVDLGSGWSTAVLALFSRHVRPLRVWSVETDDLWAARTCAFLREHVAPEPGPLFVVPELRADVVRTCDLAIVDSGPDYDARRADFARLMEWGPPPRLILDDFAEWCADLARLGVVSGRALLLQERGRIALAGRS